MHELCTVASFETSVINSIQNHSDCNKTKAAASMLFLCFNFDPFFRVNSKSVLLEQSFNSDALR